jgi:ABC-2 type transport system permease protein
VPLNLLQGWLQTIARLNPFTTVLDAARSFLAGEPTSALPAYGIGFALVLVFALWALYGLRRAERAGS